MARDLKIIGVILAGIFLLVKTFGCSMIKSEKSGAPAVARGVRTVAKSTARAVTWTGTRTRHGTAATLDFLGLIERPVPPDVLERLPDELLESLASLEFVKLSRETEKIIISSPDSRWEGELFYRLDQGESVEVSLQGPAKLIAVTLAVFSPGKKELKKEMGPAVYKLLVRVDNSAPAEVSFELAPLDLLSLYGYENWRLSFPGVFVIKVEPGKKSFRLSFERSDCKDFVLISFYLPKYEL